VISTDFYPTMLAMAGLPLRPEQHIDGKNIVPLLKQSGGLKRDALYWHFPNYIGAGHPNAARPCSVIRKGDWKLIEFLEDNRVELYNLKDDLSEKTDLASKMPDKANALRRMLEQWRKDANVQMPKPNPKYRPQGSSS
jgi:arylsulfatase A-like enzyme